MEARATLTPEEIKQGCSEYIDHGGGIGFHCAFRPTLRFKGRIYCTRHDPIRVKARSDKRMAEHREGIIQAEQARENTKDRLRQEGRREVVEWVNSERKNQNPAAWYSRWQAKLKEWGISQ